MDRLSITRDHTRTTITLRHPRSTGWLIAAWMILLSAVAFVLGAVLILLLDVPAELLSMLLPFGILPTMFLFYAVYLAAWLSSGREEAEVADGVLTIRTIALGVPWSTRRFAVRDVSHVRFQPLPAINRKVMYAIALEPGTIAFDHGGRTMRFGKWPSVEEGIAAAEALREAVEAATGSPASDAAMQPLRAMRHRITRTADGVTVTMPLGNTPMTRRTLLFSLSGIVFLMPLFSLFMLKLFADTRMDAGMIAIIVGMPLLVVLLFVAPIFGLSLSTREVVRVSGGTLEVRARPVLLTLMAPRRFDTRYVHSLRYEPVAPVSDDLATLYSTYMKGDYGHIAFGYGAEEHRFGQAVDGPEAREVVETIAQTLAADPAAGTLAREAYDAAMRARSGA